MGEKNLETICKELGDEFTGLQWLNITKDSIWKKLFPTVYIETMKGDFESNTVYYSKQGKLIEHGKPPRQGERTDLMELKHQLDSGRRPMEIVDEVDGMFGIVAHTERFSENYFEYKRRNQLENDRRLPEVYIRWGPPGTGKTVPTQVEKKDCQRPADQDSSR